MLTNLSIATIVVAAFFPLLAIFVVALRLMARRMKSQSLQMDDWLIVVALMITVGSCTVYILGAAKDGIGFHIEDIPPERYTAFYKIIFALQFTYLGAVTFAKLSILYFYKRVFITKWFGKAVNVMMGIVIAWLITFFFATLFQVTPIKDNWHPGSPGHYINEYGMYTATAVTNMVLDMTTLTLPWFVIWTLHMGSRQKWLVSGIFLLGGLVCIASIVRLYYITQFLHPTVAEKSDPTYALANIILWSALEPCLSVICACLPTLGPIFQAKSVESLIGSVRSFFSIGSQQRSSRSDRSGQTDESDKLHSQQSSQKGTNNASDHVSLEHLVMDPDGKMVRSSQSQRSEEMV